MLVNSTFIKLPSLNHKYGIVYQDLEKYNFYLFLSEEYLPNEIEVQKLNINPFNKNILKYATFDEFKLQQRDDLIIQEGYAIKICGLMLIQDSKPIFEKNREINWLKYINELQRKIKCDYSQNIEKYIWIALTSDPRFEKNYVCFDTTIEFSVIFRSRSIYVAEDENEYTYYGYINNDIDPECEFDPTKLEFFRNPEYSDCYLIPYSKKAWDELVEITTSENLIYDMIMDLINNYGKVED